MKTKLLFLTLILLSTACSQKVSSDLATNQQTTFRAERNQEPLTKSLFDFKDKTISEEAIQHILASPIELPDTIRLALLNYGSNSSFNYGYNYWNDEAFLKLQQQYIDILEEALGENGKVKKIILMPKLLVGDSPNIFTLRESAVRLQADLLFIFSINSDIYYNYKVFKKNEVKAFATCESLLMDIRTGIIPYSEVVSQDTLVLKSTTDLNDNIFRKRAENEAIQITLSEIGDKLNNYLLAQ